MWGGRVLTAKNSSSKKRELFLATGWGHWSETQLVWVSSGLVQQPWGSEDDKLWRCLPSPTTMPLNHLLHGNTSLTPKYKTCLRRKATGWTKPAVFSRPGFLNFEHYTHDTTIGTGFQLCTTHGHQCQRVIWCPFIHHVKGECFEDGAKKSCLQSSCPIPRWILFTSANRNGERKRLLSSVNTHCTVPC